MTALAIIGWVLALLFGSLLAVAARRLLQLDRFNGFIVDDVHDAATFLRKLSERDLFTNSPEIIEAHNRFVEIARRVEHYRELVNKSSMTENSSSKRPRVNRPVVE